MPMIRPLSVGRAPRADCGNLILSRSLGETIVLVLEDGRQIPITVVETAARRCRLAIQAPPTIGVWRSELLGPPAK